VNPNLLDINNETLNQLPDINDIGWQERWGEIRPDLCSKEIKCDPGQYFHSSDTYSGLKRGGNEVESAINPKTGNVVVPSGRIRKLNPSILKRYYDTNNVIETVKRARLNAASVLNKDETPGLVESPKVVAKTYRQAPTPEEEAEGIDYGDPDGDDIVNAEDQFDGRLKEDRVSLRHQMDGEIYGSPPNMRNNSLQSPIIGEYDNMLSVGRTPHRNEGNSEKSQGNIHKKNRLSINNPYIQPKSIYFKRI
jgi:hypothetical protein